MVAADSTSMAMGEGMQSAEGRAGVHQMSTSLGLYIEVVPKVAEGRTEFVPIAKELDESRSLLSSGWQVVVVLLVVAWRCSCDSVSGTELVLRLLFDAKKEYATNRYYRAGGFASSFVDSGISSVKVW